MNKITKAQLEYDFDAEVDPKDCYFYIVEKDDASWDSPVAIICPKDYFNIQGLESDQSINLDVEGLSQEMESHFMVLDDYASFEEAREAVMKICIDAGMEWKHMSNVRDETGWEYTDEYRKLMRSDIHHDVAVATCKKTEGN